MAKVALRKVKEDVEKSDAIISLACGLGTQSYWQLYSTYKKPVITPLDTVFMGETERMGKFHEKCRACGTCYLNETGGICPISTCAKSLVNGPCGGSVNGKCEVGNYTNDCGWILIYNRLKEMGRLDLFLKTRSPRDWSGSGHQRDLYVPRAGPEPGLPVRSLESNKKGGS